ncbi:MAG: YhfX family PLP-dependent enzyme [Hungatella sp.]|nr:YhfX family PLP-dependent enzyme [Hungatella sp.]
MFLHQTIKRNKKLIDTAFSLHQRGDILPDSYVIDVDMFLENAGKILKKARGSGITLYFMLKQVGRNPYLARELVNMGYEGAVAVDFKEAMLMMQRGIPLGNAGHLVQPPRGFTERLVAWGPKVITVYSREKVWEIEQAAAKLGKRQAVMLRVYEESDRIYSGQSAGFPLEELWETALWVKTRCPHVEIKGVTSFPCYFYDEAAGDILPSKNLDTVLKGAGILGTCGVETSIINTPSATCCRTLEKMARFGGTCGEPGHGLSGTTPIHAYQDLEEGPAVVYVSEISHNFLGNGYCFGGGHYRRSHVSNALVGREPGTCRQVKVAPPSAESIDYHFELPGESPVGDTVIMAFRFQMFVTRSDVVLVKGIQDGTPEIVGIYDSQGRKRDGC